MPRKRSVQTSKSKRIGRQELSDRIAEQTDISQTEASELLEITLDTIREALKNGEEIRLVGFGSFKVRNSTHKGLNLRAAFEASDFPAEEQVQFSPDKDLTINNSALVHSSPPLKEQQVASIIPDEIRIYTEMISKEVVVRIRIIENPLTAQNLNTIISALTELSTRYWLIAKSRYADLIEYTQTHNPVFAEEANAIITKVSYNSPFNMDWKFDLSAPSVAEALVTTIDGITQRKERLEKARLEVQAKVQEIKQAEQKTEQENQMALLELEQRRLEILEKQLEVQKKGIEYALEIAGKAVDLLYPAADLATRAMEIQLLLPNIIQLQGSKELELALPVPQKNEEETDKP